MAEHYASLGWSDLPNDPLIHILNLLELPEALAFRAVCPSWRSASKAAATTVPPRHTPWLVSLAADPLPGSKKSHKLWDPTVSSKFRNLVDEKTFKVSFPRGQATACCGASHGWLVVANELSDLVLYDPFTGVLVPLPPITSFSLCIEGVYGDKGNIVGYRFGSHGKTPCTDRVHGVDSLGMELYDKVVLSGSPSTGDTIALAIQLDGSRLSFARVGDGSWRHLSTIRGSNDSFADCVFHHGRFFVVTMEGILKSWDLSRLHMPKKKTIIAEDDGDFSDAITRYLVSAPWGHLLQVRVILDTDQENCVKVEIDRCDLKSRKMVALSPSKALRGLAVFLGQNSPSFLPISKFPELRPNCIYFTTPRLRNESTFGRQYNQWSGVKVYDLEKQTLEPAFPSGGGNYGIIYPSEVWFTPSLVHAEPVIHPCCYIELGIVITG
uniref:Uncharacterized protein n=1 Tax=Avena sativa TaxID=4498 RepID=A0ACD6AFF8_AVESA